MSIFSRRKNLPELAASAVLTVGRQKLAIEAIPMAIADFQYYRISVYPTSACCGVMVDPKFGYSPSSARDSIELKALSCLRCSKPIAGNLGTYEGDVVSSFFRTSLNPFSALSVRPFENRAVKSSPADADKSIDLRERFLWPAVVNTGAYFKGMLEVFSDQTDWEKIIEAGKLNVGFRGTVGKIELEARTQEHLIHNQNSKALQKMGFKLEDQSAGAQ